jgi:hypothetical protein
MNGGQIADLTWEACRSCKHEDEGRCKKVKVAPLTFTLDPEGECFRCDQYDSWVGGENE